MVSVSPSQMRPPPGPALDRAGECYVVDQLAEAQSNEPARGTGAAPLASVAASVEPIEWRAHVLASALLTGITEALRDIAAGHAIDRVQFGKPIAGHQLVQRHLAQIAVDTAAARLVLISIVIAIPVGIMSARSDRFQVVLKPLLDAMRTMPAFVYLVPVIALFQIGRVPGVIASVIYALPPAIRARRRASRAKASLLAVLPSPQRRTTTRGASRASERSDSSPSATSHPSPARAFPPSCETAPPTRNAGSSSSWSRTPSAR